MAEDQGINGDKWTQEASALLKRLNWQKVADSNIDIEGSDGYMHGIDALFRYEDGFTRQQQGVFLEAKRYHTMSFAATKLQDWVEKLNQKMLQLRRSEDFNFTYPAMSETNPQNGLLVIWFHDTENYREFEPKFKNALATVRVSRGRSICNRLFVVGNDCILRLCSLISAIEKSEHQIPKGTNQRLCFFYPSSAGYGLLPQFSPVLNLEYIFSKFLIAKFLDYQSGVPKPVYIIYYFGKLDVMSFTCLKNALLQYNVPPDTDANLYIYCYHRDDDFRKIQPDVDKVFKEAGKLNVMLYTMDKYSDLPGWMKDS